LYIIFAKLRETTFFLHFFFSPAFRVSTNLHGPFLYCVTLPRLKKRFQPLHPSKTIKEAEQSAALQVLLYICSPQFDESEFDVSPDSKIMEEMNVTYEEHKLNQDNSAETQGTGGSGVGGNTIKFGDILLKHEDLLDLTGNRGVLKRIIKKGVGELPGSRARITRKKFL
jgi:hypothetical protein